MVDGASDKEEVVDKNLFVYMSKVRPEVPIRNGVEAWEKEELTGVQLLVATFRHMRHRNQILVIPITIWSGIEQGFFNAAFTAVSAN